MFCFQRRFCDKFVKFDLSKMAEEVYQNTCEGNVGYKLTFDTGQQRIQTASVGLLLGAKYTFAF